ncbi:hypothetical protein ACFC08_36930 [Streptomyces sp. NPDC056112]|uniref:hypothetical protein n=1 Tax=Streptomyces sp. NPDC056112 TaxID=3345715 RepID=UPI0035DAA05F
MTTRPAARRLVTRIAPPLGGGALALAATSYIGVPGWAVVLAAVAGAMASVLPALLPQESEHRRDVWRDWLRHRERMARLRISAANSRPGTAGLRNDHHEQSGRPRHPAWRRPAVVQEQSADLCEELTGAEPELTDEHRSAPVRPPT